MANPYDQFDEKPSGNPYDQFDEPRQQGAIEQGIRSGVSAAMDAVGSAKDWAVQSFQGPQDLPKMPEFNAPAPKASGTAKAALGLMMSNNPEAQFDILRRQYPGIKLTPLRSKETGGEYVVADWEDDSGKRHIGYVNAPGMTGRDVAAIGGQGAAMVPAVRFGQGANMLTGAARTVVPKLLPRMFRTGLATAGTRAGLDKAMEPLGSRQGIDPVEAGVTGVAGAAAEAVAPAVTGLLRTLRPNPIMRGEQLTPRGSRMAQEGGLDPRGMPPDALREFARLAPSGDLSAAAVAARNKEFGIRASRGQVSQDYQQLNLEDRLRRGLEGPEAQAVMKQLDEGQQQDIIGATQKVQSRLQPRPSADLPEASSRFLSGVQRREQAAREATDAAYEELRALGPAQIKTTDYEGLIGRFEGVLASGDRVVDRDLTPGTVYAVNQLRERLKPSAEGVVDLQDFEKARRVLGNAMGAAKNPSDKSNIRLLRREMDEWLDETVDAGLMSGDPAVTEALKKARAARAQYGAQFEARDGKDAAGKIMQKIVDKAATPEMALNYVLSQSDLGNQRQAVVAVRRLKDVLGDDSEAWNALREAAWNNLARDRRGVPKTAQQFRNSWQNLVTNNRSLQNVLFSPEERQLMQRYMQALKTTDRPPTNPSSTAFGLESAIRYMLRRQGQREAFTKGNVGTGAILNALARSPLNPFGVADWAKRMQAARAVSPLPGGARPSVAAVAGLTPTIEQAGSN